MRGIEYRVHDKEVLDALESLGTSSLDSRVWRITRKGRDPVRSSASNGRWSTSGEFEVLYTSEVREGALAEIGFRLGLEPVWPTLIQHELHELRFRARSALTIPDMKTLEKLGVDGSRYKTFEYKATQSLSAAAKFLGVDALVAPSARFDCMNVVGIIDNLSPEDLPEVISTIDVDWDAWRSAGR